MITPTARARRRPRRQAYVEASLLLSIQWCCPPLQGSEAFALRNLSHIKPATHRCTAISTTATRTATRSHFARATATTDFGDGLEQQEHTGAEDDSGEEYDEYDEDEDEDEDEDDEFEVHPSASWLYDPASNPKPRGSKPMRLTMGVDYGLARVGLAVSMGISPRILHSVSNRGSDLEVARKVLIQARGEGVRNIVVGFPLMR